MSLDITAQLRLNGTWTDITADVRQADGVQITRGRSGEGESVEPSSCSLTLDNRSGNYSPRNPMGAHFGVLGRNTPLRVLGPATEPNHLILSGGDGASISDDDPSGFASTNTIKPYATGGDIDIRVDVAPLNWRPAEGYGLAMEFWDTGTATDSWALSLTATGNLLLWWSATGSTILSATSTVAVPDTSERLAVRATLDVNNGSSGRTVTFYTAPDLGGAWTLLGSAVVTAGVTSVFSGNSVAAVGRGTADYPWRPLQGKLYGFEFRNGIGGTVAVSADFTTLDVGDAEWVDAQGNAWGLRGRAVMANSAARFHGEVSSLPQRWDKTGRDVYTPAQASGILRRLGQGTAPLRSVMYRAMSSADGVVAYWPCEDGEDATEFGSALPGYPAMTHPNGPTELTEYTGFRTSERMPVASGIYWTGRVPSYTATGQTQVRFLMRVPPAGPASLATVCRVRCTSAGAPEWELDIGASGTLRLRAFDSEYSVIHDSGFKAHDVNGKALLMSIEFEDLGADTNYAITTTVVDAPSSITSTGTVAGKKFGRATNVGMNVGGGILTDTILGHISVQNTITPILQPDRDRITAYAGEEASKRILRLCHELDVPVSIVGDVDDAARMGAQLPGTFLDLLHEAVDADMGILLEPREHLGLAYRTRASLYAQDAALTLDYGSGAVSGIEPTEDDDATRNDITVSRVNGSSARASLETGPLSVNAPPDGVGRYDDEATVSLRRDEDLADQASWRLHLGTVDEPRYPVLGVNLAASAFTSDAVLTADAQAFDVGDRLVVSGAPSATTSPEDIQQIAQGFTETITPFEWLIDTNCTPASVWDVAVWDDESGPGEARYSSDGTTLEAGVSSSATVLLVDTPTGPLWSAEDGPFDITIGGERMTVTDVVTNVEGASFETDGAWAVLGPDVTVAQNAFEALDGVYAALLTIDGTPMSAFNGVQLGGADVVAGQWLAVHVPVRPDGAVPVEAARVRIHWLDAAGVQIATDTTARIALSAFSYNTLTHSALAPVNTASAQVSLFFASTASDIPVANSTGRTDAWAVAAAASQAEALALVGSGYGQQFMAVTRSVNGVVKTHTSGADVALAKIAIYAL